VQDDGNGHDASNTRHAVEKRHPEKEGGKLGPDFRRDDDDG